MRLDVLLVEKQDASCGVTVPARSARLLQVVLQRAWNVGVDHDPDVGLVDTHAEGVGRRDGGELTLHEALLDVLLQLRDQSTMETAAGRAGGRDQFGHHLRRLARGAEDDPGTAVREFVL